MAVSTTPHLLALALAALCLLATLSLSAGGDSQSPRSAAAADSAPARLSSAPSASSLAHLLRRRSAELQAPPPHYYASRLGAGAFLGPAPSKRDDSFWIWMPAHGYMSVPRDELVASSGDKDGMGNLLRYGRK